MDRVRQQDFAASGVVLAAQSPSQLRADRRGRCQRDHASGLPPMHVHGLGWHRPTERAEHAPACERDGARGVGRRVQVGKVLPSCTLHRSGLVSGDSDVINVRFGPLCGLKSDISQGPSSANSGPEQVQQTEQAYSITSSASASTVGGTSRPSALAVLRLIINGSIIGGRRRGALEQSGDVDFRTYMRQ